MIQIKSRTLPPNDDEQFFGFQNFFCAVKIDPRHQLSTFDFLTSIFFLFNSFQKQNAVAVQPLSQNNLD